MDRRLPTAIRATARSAIGRIVGVIHARRSPAATENGLLAGFLLAFALAGGIGCGDGDIGTTIDDPATLEVVVDFESGQLTWGENGLAGAMADPSKPVRFVMKTSDGTTLADIEGSSLNHLREKVADLPAGYFQGYLEEYLAEQQENLDTAQATERTDRSRQQSQAIKESRE